MPHSERGPQPPVPPAPLLQPRDLAMSRARAGAPLPKACSLRQAALGKLCASDSDSARGLTHLPVPRPLKIHLIGRDGCNSART